MQEILLTADSLPGFAHLIPPYLYREAEQGELIGAGGVDLDGPEDAPMAVLLCRGRHDWMEIVWLAADPAYRGIDAAGWLLDGRLSAARLGRKVWGAFADLPQGEARPAVEHILKRRGFTLTEVEQPVYQTTVGALSGVEALGRPAKDQQALIPLSQADRQLQADVLQAIRQDSRPVPLSQPVDWTAYDTEMSAIYVREGNPCGLCLVSRSEDSLTLELLWAAHKLAAAPLLAHAAQAAARSCPPETRVVIPTVTEVSAQIAERLIPGAAAMKLTQARLPFYQTAPSLMELEVETDG